jgi:hypothetical protein
MGKTFTIEKLQSAPKAFVGLTERVNQLIKAVKVLSEMKGDGNINVEVTDSNVLFSLGGVGRSRINGGGTGFRAVPASITIAGIIPTVAEVKDGIEDAYDSINAIPEIGDLIYMTQFHYLVSNRKDISGTNIVTSNLFRLVFTVDGVDYMALQIGPNRLL